MGMLDNLFRRSKALILGPYRLDMKMDSIAGLSEISAAEKVALQLIMEFKNTRIFHAPHAYFAGLTWEILLGAVDGNVYKVSALTEFNSSETRNTAWQNVVGVLRNQLGTPETLTENILAWNTKDGNVILNRSDSNNAVVITLTSCAIRYFERL
jgi:hypothetical protein